jgi:hypothetical protein
MLLRGCSVSRVSALSGSAAAAATAGRLCCLHSRGQGELGARLQHTEAQGSAGRSPGPHTDEDCFDVVVVGGGVVGATVACALATAPAACSMRLALLDAKPPPDIPPPAPCAGWTVEEPPNARAYALSATSAEILDALGVWSEVCARPMGRFDRMQVWDEAGGGYVRLSAGQDGDNAGSGLGYIVEDRVSWQLARAGARERPSDPGMYVCPACCLQRSPPPRLLLTILIRVAFLHVATAAATPLFAGSASAAAYAAASLAGALARRCERRSLSVATAGRCPLSERRLRAACVQTTQDRAM